MAPTAGSLADQPFSCAASSCLTDTGTGMRDLNERSNELKTIYETVCSAAQPYVFRGQRISRETERAMVGLGVLWVFRMQFRTVRGMVLIGPRLRNDRLADEQLLSLSLLIEQFAATLHNRQLEQLRLRAERHAMQQEKLSMLGLMAGTLSHELRNPLSSMRTISQLMLEDIGATSPHARDVSLILSEIDRLTQTTTRLLDFSRPPSDQCDRVCPDRVLSRLLAVLEHLAREHHVILEVKLASSENQIAGSEASLSEVLFNLVKNAIEAAGSIVSRKALAPVSSQMSRKGTVVVETRVESDKFCCIVQDNGPGMTPAVQANMFEPFVTAKIDGTGLGLYIVGQRVRELQGVITCDSRPDHGTRFEVRLPLWLRGVDAHSDC